MINKKNEYLSYVVMIITNIVQEENKIKTMDLSRGKGQRLLVAKIKKKCCLTGYHIFFADIINHCIL